MARERRQPRTYSDEDRKAALKLAANIGMRAAGRELDISLTLLSNWRNKFPGYWDELLRGKDPEQATQHFASRVDELAQSYAEVELEALDRASKLIPRADGKELAALGKMLSQGRTTAVSTAGRLRGDPDERHQVDINFGQLEQAMEAILNGAAAPPQLPPVSVPNLAIDD